MAAAAEGNMQWNLYNISEILERGVMHFVQLETPLTKRVSFNEAILRGELFKERGEYTISMKVSKIFEKVKEAVTHLRQNPGFTSQDEGDGAVKRAFNCLFNFLDDHKNFEYDICSTSWSSEADFNVYVAKNILQPLSGGLCVLNNNHKSALKVCKKEDRAYPFVKTTEEVGWDGLGMACQHDCYFGEPDMIVIPEKKEDAATAIEGTLARNQSGDSLNEPETKKRKTERGENDGDSPGGKTEVEGKKAAKLFSTVHDLSQSIATAITFAHIQHERHENLHSFPVVRIHPLGFDIFIYNTKYDLLLLNCFSWSKAGCILLWLVLNYQTFPICSFSEKQKYTCGFKVDDTPKGNYRYCVNKNTLTSDKKSYGITRTYFPLLVPEDKA